MKTIKDDTLDFPFVIAEIQTFLEPVFDAIVNEDEWQKEWFCRKSKRSFEDEKMLYDIIQKKGPHVPEIAPKYLNTLDFLQRTNN